jgi:hypothetical protein
MFRSYPLYRDIEAALNKALAYGSGSVRCLSHGGAINWRQRAYRFRRLWQEYTREAYAGIPEKESEAGTSPWDEMILRLEGNNVLIVFERREVVFIAPDGHEESLQSESSGAVGAQLSGPLGLETIETIAEGVYRIGPKLEG